MLNTHAGAVQAQLLPVDGGCRAIAGVAGDYQPAMGQLGSDLVFASGQQPYCQQGV
jgi:hypothetical protein